MQGFHYKTLRKIGISAARVYAGPLLRGCSQLRSLKPPVYRTSNYNASYRTSPLYSPVCAVSFASVRLVPVFPALRLSVWL